MIINHQNNVAAFVGGHTLWWPGQHILSRIVEFVVSTEGLTLKLLLGTTELLTTGVLVPTSGLSNKEWKFDAIFVIRALTGSNNISAQAEFDNGTQENRLSADPTVTLSVAQELHLAAKHEVAAASNKISVQNFLVEKL